MRKVVKGKVVDTEKMVKLAEVRFGSVMITTTFGKLCFMTRTLSRSTSTGVEVLQVVTQSPWGLINGVRVRSFRDSPKA